MFVLRVGGHISHEFIENQDWGKGNRVTERHRITVYSVTQLFL